MSSSISPSVEELRRCFREENGRLFWALRPREHFESDELWKKWMGQLAGKEAGTQQFDKREGQGNRPRWRVGFQGKTLSRYSIIWAIHYGEWRRGIDHKDRDPTNDRICNLRAATASQNKANHSTPKNNRCGFKGVVKTKTKWAARIKIGGRLTHLGTFDNPESASAAYAKAARQQFGEFACI